MADLDITVVTGIEGLEELEEAFTTGSSRAVKKFLRKVEMEAAQILVKSAEENAPYEEGDLANDIHRQSIVSDGALTVRVGPSKQAFYGMMQEFGAPEANIVGTHWLEQSARNVQDEVLAKYYEGVSQGLEEMKK